MTGLRTVGGGLPGPYTVTTNLCTNPDFRDLNGATLEIRRNLALDPAGTRNVNAAAHCGWFHMWYGTATGNGLTTVVAGANDGPLTGVTSYVRKTWSAAPTSNADTGFYNTAATAGTGFLPIEAGATYTVSSYLRTNAAGKRGRIRISWIDNTDSFLSGEVYQFGSATNTPTLVPNAWTRLNLTATAPANAVKARFLSDIGYVTGDPLWAPGDTLDGTALLVEKSSRLGSYFDGRTAAGSGLTYTWSATADNSNAVAQGMQARSTPSARSNAYRLDPSGGILHRPNELNYASTDVYLSPGGDLGAFRNGMEPGKTYTFSAEGMASAADAGEASTARTAMIFWRKADGAYASVKSPVVPVGTMTRVSITATIPADATEAFLRLYNGSNLRDMTWQNILLQEGSTASPYFDGGFMEDATSHYQWTGTADASTSEKITRLPFSAFAPDGTTLATMQKVLPRTNLLLNPSFRSSSASVVVRTNRMWTTGTAGWSVSNPVSGVFGPVTVIPSGAPDDGQAYLRITITGATSGSGGGFVFGSQASGVLPVVPGGIYSARILARASIPIPGYLLVRWYDNTGTQVGNNSMATPNLVLSDTAWTEFKLENLTAPAGATRGFVTMYRATGSGWAVGDWMEVAGGLFEDNAGAYLGYFNAYSASDPVTGWTYSWAGAAGQSTSYWSAPLRGSGGNLQPYQTNRGGNVPGDALRVMQIGPTNSSLYLFHSVADVPASPGDYFTARWQARWISGSPVVLSPRVGFYGTSSFMLYAGQGNNVALPSDGSWVDVVIPATTPAPVGAVSARLMCYPGAGQTASGTTFEVRRCILEKVSGPVTAGNVGSYFEGGSAADADYTYAWTGTADASTSRANP